MVETDANHMFQAYTSTPQENSQTLGSQNYRYPWEAAHWASVGLAPDREPISATKAESHYPNVFAPMKISERKEGGQFTETSGPGELSITSLPWYAHLVIFQKIIAKLCLKSDMIN